MPLDFSADKSSKTLQPAALSLPFVQTARGIQLRVARNEGQLIEVEVIRSGWSGRQELFDRCRAELPGEVASDYLAALQANNVDSPRDAIEILITSLDSHSISNLPGQYQRASDIVLGYRSKSIPTLFRDTDLQCADGNTLRFVQDPALSNFREYLALIYQQIVSIEVYGQCNEGDSKPLASLSFTMPRTVDGTTVDADADIVQRESLQIKLNRADQNIGDKKSQPWFFDRRSNSQYSHIVDRAIEALQAEGLDGVSKYLDEIAVSAQSEVLYIKRSAEVLKTHNGYILRFGGDGDSPYSFMIFDKKSAKFEQYLTDLAQQIVARDSSYAQSMSQLKPLFDTGAAKIKPLPEIKHARVQALLSRLPYSIRVRSDNIEFVQQQFSPLDRELAAILNYQIVVLERNDLPAHEPDRLVLMLNENLGGLIRFEDSEYDIRTTFRILSDKNNSSSTLAATVAEFVKGSPFIAFQDCYRVSGLEREIQLNEALGQGYYSEIPRLEMDQNKLDAQTIEYSLRTYAYIWEQFYEMYRKRQGLTKSHVSRYIVPKIQFSNNDQLFTVRLCNHGNLTVTANIPSRPRRDHSWPISEVKLKLSYNKWWGFGRKCEATYTFTFSDGECGFDPGTLIRFGQKLADQSLKTKKSLQNTTLFKRLFRHASRVGCYDIDMRDGYLWLKEQSEDR